MTKSMYMQIEEMLADSQLTRIQLTNDIKSGLIPGMIVRRQPRVLRSEWEAYRNGDWKPARKPAEFIHRINPGKAA